MCSHVPRLIVGDVSNRYGLCLKSDVHHEAPEEENGKGGTADRKIQKERISAGRNT